jgi:hypothetical protein
MGQEGLSQLPLDELREMVGTMAGGGSMPPGAIPVEGMAEPQAPLASVPPGLVEAATSRLVEMGLLAQPTQEITPEVLDAIQQAADALFPGLLDATNPNELMEAINVILSDHGPIDGAADQPGGPGGSAGPGGRLLLG